MSGIFLTLNAGSSSIKFAVFDTGVDATTALIKGKITGIGNAPIFSASGTDGTQLDAGALTSLEHSSNHETIIPLLLPWLEMHNGKQPLVAVGHRVVHGGQHFAQPTLITPPVLELLASLTPLAPLHQPHNIAAIKAVAKWSPDTPQIACFDTSFHRTQDRLAELFALPRDLSDQGIIRYGFHGLSYDYIASALPQHIGDQASGRIIVAHLGNGSSMCAMKNQKSVASSMGFTALDGLMMGRRCGTLDPGVVLYLMQSKGMAPAEIENLLYKQSGLLGVSGISNDMQVLQNSDNPHARDAIDLFCYRAACSLASLVTPISGLDTLVFTAGIGENSALVRKLICEQLAWLGISIDIAANEANATTISTTESKVEVLMIPTNEEAVVARACRAHLSAAAQEHPTP